jgi:hypothetical protein
MKKKQVEDDPEKDIDACDHVDADQSVTEDEDLPETNLVPGLDEASPKPKTKKRVNLVGSAYLA